MFGQICTSTQAQSFDELSSHDSMANNSRNLCQIGALAKLQLDADSSQRPRKTEIRDHRNQSVAETGSSSGLDTRVAFLGPAVVYIFSLIQSDSLRSSVLHSTTNCLRAESEDCLPECAVHWSRGEGSDALGNCLELLPLGLSACKKGFS